MNGIKFFKMQASGNDFILVDARRQLSAISYQLSAVSGQKTEVRSQRSAVSGQRSEDRSQKSEVRGQGSAVSGQEYSSLAKEWCERKFGIGADGLLVIEPSLKADFKMRIFNSDGSEAEMCGNGSRCAALWAQVDRGQKTEDRRQRGRCDFETMAGIIAAEAAAIKEGSADVRIKMTDVSKMELDKELKVLGMKIKVNFINSGVPHTVVFVQGLDSMDIDKIGAAVRVHKEFAPTGTNVDFVEILKDSLIKIRTYERGVEAETLACGTGAVAGAVISRYKLENKTILGNRKYRMSVVTKSGETLAVYFSAKNDKITDIWLQGKAYLVYKGIIA